MSDLIKFEPMRELLDIRDAFDKIFARGLSEKRLDITDRMNFAPKIEVLDKKDTVVIKAEVPGINKKDLDVKIDNGNLVIRGETRKEDESQEKGYYYSERSYGSFYRSISLPDTIDEKGIKAKYKDGILEINLPKTKEAKEKSKPIEVE